MVTLKSPYELFAVECGEGWSTLYTPILNLCAKLDIEITQVKEKFGVLRVYIGPVDADIADAIYGAISHAEEASSHVCEQCGVKDDFHFAPGTDKDPGIRLSYNGEVITRAVKGGMWLRTLCLTCHALNDNRYANMYVLSDAAANTTGGA